MAKAWPKVKAQPNIKQPKNKGMAEGIGKPCLLDCSEPLQAHSATSTLELVVTLYSTYLVHMDSIAINHLKSMA